MTSLVPAVQGDYPWGGLQSPSAAASMEPSDRFVGSL